MLVNLVKNAMDAIVEKLPARRQITIRSAVRTVDADISVCDTGPGVPAEIMGRLFTPFVTMKVNGLGIGLTIAQRIVEAHAGTIAAHENVDGGATFTVTLPCSATAGSSHHGWARRIHRERIVSAVSAGRGRP